MPTAHLMDFSFAKADSSFKDENESQEIQYGHMMVLPHLKSKLPAIVVKTLLAKMKTIALGTGHITWYNTTGCTL